MMSPTGRRAALEQITRRGVSQRAACRYLGLSRRVAQYTLRQPAKDRALGEELMATAQTYPRFGYRRSAAWLDQGLSRVRRLWAQLGLNLPRRRPRRRRCGTDMRLPGEPRPNSVWSYDFVHDRLANQRAMRMLCVVDEHTRECLAIEVARSLTSRDVILTLAADAAVRQAAFSARTTAPNSRPLRYAMAARSTGRASVHPACKPWHNGFVESFNGKLRDECLNREWFRTCVKRRS